MLTDPLYIIAVLCANIAVSEVLARHTPLRLFGSALLVIVITAIEANIGILPPYSPGSDLPVYDIIVDPLARAGIFLLLLRVNLRSLRHAGLPMVSMFLLGSAGTVIGVTAGMWVVGGESAFGNFHGALAGMFVGTYIGGSANFQALAIQYEVNKEGNLYLAANLVDSAMTTVWMVFTVTLPRLLRKAWPGWREAAAKVVETESEITSDDHDTESLQPLDVGIIVGLAAFGVWISGAVAEWTGTPSIIVLTTIALVMAQLRPIQRLRGARVLGMFAVLLFLAVIGALCNLAALAEVEGLGVDLMVFVAVTVFVHGVVIFVGGGLFRVDPAIIGVASQANIGGGTSALAAARSLGRNDLVLPAILVGSLGTALGTYLGHQVAQFLM